MYFEFTVKRHLFGFVEFSTFISYAVIGCSRNLISNRSQFEALSVTLIVIGLFWTRPFNLYLLLNLVFIKLYSMYIYLKNYSLISINCLIRNLALFLAKKVSPLASTHWSLIHIPPQLASTRHQWKLEQAVQHSRLL